MQFSRRVAFLIPLFIILTDRLVGSECHRVSQWATAGKTFMGYLSENMDCHWRLMMNHKSPITVHIVSHDTSHYFTLNLHCVFVGECIFFLNEGICSNITI